MKIHPETNEGIVRVGELAVPFHDTGSPKDDRPTVVLLHGTGGSASTHFRTLYPMLAVKYRVLAVDLQIPEPKVTLNDLTEQVCHVIDERVPGQQIHLVGYSLGSLVAASVAATTPSAFDALVLVAGWIKADEHQKLRNHIWQRLFETDQDLLKEFATWTVYGHPFLASKSEAEVRHLVEGREFPEGIAAQMRLNVEADISGKLASIIAPTLVVAGAHDQMVPSHQTKLLYGGISDARYAVIESGHAIPQERPAQLFQIIDGFLTNPNRTPAGQVQEPILV